MSLEQSSGDRRDQADRRDRADVPDRRFPNTDRRDRPGGGGFGAPPGLGRVRIRGEGLVARFAPIRGVTPKGALASRMYLPAMLGSLVVDEEANHSEYDTLSAGTFSQPAMGPPSARKLRSTQPQAIVVDSDPGWLVASGQDPNEVRDRLLAILRHRKPVHLLVTFNPPSGRHPELDMYCTMRSHSKELKPGERESRYVTLSLSEWRDPSVRVRSARPVHGESWRKPGEWAPATRKLEAGDTLVSLSMLYYGRYDFWQEIRAANGIPRRFGQSTPIVSLGGRFKVGSKVKIPEVHLPVDTRSADSRERSAGAL